MSKDVAARLSALAQDHREGRLTLATYRELRAPLLDGLVADNGEGDLSTVTQPRGGARRSEEATADAAAELLAPAAPKRASTSKRVLGTIMMIAAVFVLIGAGGFWGWQKLAESRAQAAPEITVAETNAVIRNIRAFLDRGDWSDERVDAFRFILGEASQREMVEARESPTFRALRDEVRKRFKEQQALSAAPLTPTDSAIAALADKVGVDLQPGGATGAGGLSKAADKGAASKASSGSANAAAAELAAANAPGAAAAAPTKTITGGCIAELAGAANVFCRDKLSSGFAGPRLTLIGVGTREVARVNVGDAGPAPRVTIKQPFAITVQGISQAHYRRFCEDTFTPFPAQPRTGDDDPMVNVSWSEAREFLRWLSENTGQKYRLPTEDEWEYAAQGSKKSFSVGNVREWVEDSGGTDEPNMRITRGSLFAEGATTLLSDRVKLSADSRDALTGFRAVREL